MLSAVVDMAPLPTTVHRRIAPDRCLLSGGLPGYDGNSPEDEMASLIRSGIGVRIRRCARNVRRRH